MNMVIPDEGKEYWLNIATGQLAFDDLEVQLYSNNYTPVDASTASDFTPATFTGAGVVTVAEADWAAATVVANVAQADATPPPEWTHGGGASQTIYGWFAVFATDGIVAMAQRFNAARVMTTGSKESLDALRLKLKTFA